MTQENQSIDDIIEQIVCTALLGDIEYQNTEDKSKRKYLYDKQTEVVDITIDQTCKTIEMKLPKDISLKIGDIRLEVANQILVEVSQNPNIITNGFKLDEKSLMKSMNLPVKDDEEIEQKVLKEEKKEISSDAKLKEVLEEISSAREEVQNDLLEKAWGENATEDDKKAVVAATELDIMEQMISYGVKFDDLDMDEQGFIVASLRLLKQQGQSEKIQVFMDQLNITNDIIESNEYDDFDFEDCSENKEEAAIDAEIRRNAEAIKFYIRHGDIDPEKANGRFRDIEKILDSSEYAIDSLLYALQSERKKDNPRFQQILDLVKNKIKNPKTLLEWDQYIIANIASLSGELSKKSPEDAKELISLFNEKLKKDGIEEFSYEAIEELANKKTEFSDAYKIDDVMLVTGREKYKNGNFAELISDINSRKVEKEEMKEIAKENPGGYYGFDSTEMEMFRNAINNQLSEMAIKFGLTGALRLAYQNIGPSSNLLGQQKKLWLHIIEEEFNFANIASGKSIIKKSDIEILKNHLREVADEEHKDPNQTEYIINLGGTIKSMSEQIQKKDFNLQNVPFSDVISSISVDYRMFGRTKKTVEPMYKKDRLKPNYKGANDDKDQRATSDDVDYEL